ncbi:hypothetical protein EST38_g2776 [Candolleomyces aberdarensis]|uniref:F-box protein n=1 Tax=Candolleomyces aberdarensis TaxID=2316362 RepID=A0A4Q2DUR6_9AGAR|nr:hypothetical protein EST38_g2776 [Candolleomyces aberdarensis]
MEDNLVHTMTVQWAFSHVHRLEQLELSNLDDNTPGDFLDVLIPSIPLDNLQKLVLGTVSLMSIPILMSAPHLLELRMMIEDKEIRRPTTPCPLDTISSLRSLVISTKNIDAAIIALEYLPRRNQLQAFIFDEYQSLSSASAHHLFNLIKSKCNPHTFSKLELKGGIAGWEQEEVDIDDYVDISALFSLSALTDVDIFLPATRVELTSEQATTIPSAWPRIENLVLNTTRGGPIRTSCPRIDHTHLTAILRGCPNLRVLGVCFDATLIREEQHNPSGNEGEEGVDWQCNLEKFDVGDSPILSPSRVAAFLTAHCPSLRKLDCCSSDYYGARQEFFTLYEERWKTVASQIGL